MRTKKYNRISFNSPLSRNRSGIKDEAIGNKVIEWIKRVERDSPYGDL